MSLTSAMFTGLTGLYANQFIIDTSGDNIANLNTTAFKGNRATFENQFVHTLSGGTPPGTTTGGTNPRQIGKGVALAAIQRNFTPGAVETTGVPTDLAIEGAGFFVVDSPNEGRLYTRDGTFRLDALNTLVTSDGFNVLGYGVDGNFQIDRSTLTRLQIPLGSMGMAKATSNAFFDGNLNANGTIATQGSVLRSQELLGAGGVPATAATLLTDLQDAASPGVPLFAAGDVLTFANVKKGGRQLPQRTLTVTAATTLGDLATAMQNHMGISQDPAAGGTPGVTIDANGRILIQGNSGEDNALELDLSAIRSSNVGFPAPFMFTETQAANGESVHTSFIAFDSLGTPVQVGLTMVLVNKTNAGQTWRFYADSYDDTDASPVLGDTGTISFNNDGQVTNVTNNRIRIDRAATGALTPLVIDLDFSRMTGLTTEDSTAVMTLQDGFTTGSLTSFSVGSDGVITGTYSNGLTRPLGQVAVATFTNPEGLLLGANNMYYVGANSGQPRITTPESFGAGRIVAGSLEMSNVDLTREFIGLITATAGFSASGRVISTSNDLLNELLLIAR